MQLGDVERRVAGGADAVEGQQRVALAVGLEVHVVHQQEQQLVHVHLQREQHSQQHDAN